MSVRQRAVDLLYAMCDRTNAEEIVGEMLAYLETADYSIREEMVLKVAILAEKYAVDYTWYVDIILNLIRIAGDFVSEEVWYRVIQIVINRDDVQGYAAKTVFEVRAPSKQTDKWCQSTICGFTQSSLVTSVLDDRFVNLLAVLEYNVTECYRLCRRRRVTRTWSKWAVISWESLVILSLVTLAPGFHYTRSSLFNCN